MTVLTQNGFRVKLHAFYSERPVPDAHDLIPVAGVILSPGSDFKAVRQGLAVDDQRVITRCRERIAQAFEHAFVGMVYGRELAVHDFLRTDHITAKGQQIILEINGVKSTELIDQEKGHFDLSGFLGLQLRSGEPMTVQFKDIYLRKL